MINPGEGDLMGAIVGKRSMKVAVWVKVSAFLLFSQVMMSCGTDNVLEKYDTESRDDLAKKALNSQDYDTAIEIYTELIASEPEGYFRYPLLSAAQAGKAGINILEIVKEKFASSGGTGGVLDSIGAYIPSNPTSEQVDNIKAAVATLERMPPAHRSEKTGFDECNYCSGAAFQYNLYLGSSSVMVMKKYTKKDDKGKVNREQLNEMTDEEVEYILDNLDEIAASSGESESSSNMGASVGAVLEEIKSSPGESDKEKLIAYIEKSESS